MATTAQEVKDYALYDHAGPGLLEYAVVNVAAVRPSLKRKYLSAQVKPVEVDLEELNRLGSNGPSVTLRTLHP